MGAERGLAGQGRSVEGNVVMRSHRSPMCVVLGALLAASVGFSYSATVMAQDTSDPNADLGKDASTEINVKNADIAAIVRIFSKKTKRNYILDEAVKGKVSIYLPGKVSPDESIRILEAVLALKGFTSVPIGENLWKIIPAREAKGSTIPTLTESKDGKATAAMVTRLVPLKYVAAADMQQLMSQMISPNGTISAYEGTNSLIIIDSENNVERLVNIVENLDVPFSDREMTIIPIVHAEAADIAEKLTQILGTDGSGGGDPNDPNASPFDLVRARIRQTAARTNGAMGMPGQMGGVPPGGMPGGPAGGAIEATTVAARARAPKIIADDRTNALIVVADEDTTTRVRALVSELDSPIDRSGSRFWVYRAEHADAQDLAEVLSGLSGSGGSSSSSSRDGQRNPLGSTGDSFGTGASSTTGRSRSTGAQDRLARQRRTPGQSRRGDERGGGVTSVQFGDDFQITADPATNSLIMSGSRSDYLKVLELLKHLDVKRRQVLVEALLLEVGITDSTDLSTEFLVSTGGEDGGIAAQNNNGGLAQLLADPRKLQGFSVAAASAGTLELPGGLKIPTQSLLVRAAQSNSNVNVLSSPNILTADNEEAEIVVGQNVPFLASTSSSNDNLNNTFNQIDRQDVGITLRLTPRISSGEFVTLNLFTEVSNLVLETLQSDLGPTTSVRTSETTVIVKDGQMVVIGGLMSDDGNETETGIPFLKDIPVVGSAFKSWTRRFRKTNLLIFIRPRVIKDQFDLRETTVEQRDRVEQVIAFDNMLPDRNIVLHNPSIDRVSEAVPFEGEKPTTIRPAKNENFDLADDRFEPAAMKRPPVEVRKNRETVEVEVVPELPAVEAKDEEAFLDAGSVKETGKAEASAAKVSGKGLKGEELVVLAVEELPNADAALPFKAPRKGALVGLVIPEGGTGLFALGERYSYKVADSQLKGRVVGRFQSRAEAEDAYAALKQNWYTLSPYEIMNFGKGPWTNSVSQ